MLLLFIRSYEKHDDYTHRLLIVLTDIHHLGTTMESNAHVVHGIFLYYVFSRFRLEIIYIRCTFVSACLCYFWYVLDRYSIMYSKTQFPRCLYGSPSNYYLVSV